MTPLLQVALGGALGASARFLAGNAITRQLGHGFPAGTLVVNVVGSFLMGVLVVVLARKGVQGAAPFLMTGLLGGFTTFSAFSLDAITLVERGQLASASLYVIGSVIMSLVAVFAGLFFTRMVMP